MGWICVTDGCTILSNGLWDGSGIAFFSIADEIGFLHLRMFEFLMGISGTTYLFAFFLLIITLVISTMVSIKRVVKDVIR